MNRIAIISDVHGNIPALDAVLADIDARGVDAVYCLGDMIGKGPDSREAVALCRARCEVIISGNWENGFFDARHEPIVAWHIERMGLPLVRELDRLPFCHDFWMSGRRVRLLHGSAETPGGYILPHDRVEKQMTLFANTEQTGVDCPIPDVVGYGHLHKAFQLPVGKHRRLFNTGSVGNPTDETTAAYAILTGVLDSAERAPFSIEHIRVPYDIEYAIELARLAQLPDLTAYEFELRTARYRGEMEDDA